MIASFSLPLRLFFVLVVCSSCLPNEDDSSLFYVVSAAVLGVTHQRKKEVNERFLVTWTRVSLFCRKRGKERKPAPGRTRSIVIMHTL